MWNLGRAACLVAALSLAGAAGADAAQAVAAAERHLAAREAAIVGELRSLLALPNVAASEDDIRANAELLVTMLERRGVHARVLETPGAPVAVFGERRVPGATRTLLFYAHFDGQPVGPESAWRSPPFEPVLRAGRLEDGAVVIPWPEARHPLPDRPQGHRVRHEARPASLGGRDNPDANDKTACGGCLRRSGPRSGSPRRHR